MQCFTLYSLLNALQLTKIDYFSLDVEGAEIDILETIPFEVININVITIEYRITYYQQRKLRINETKSLERLTEIENFFNKKGTYRKVAILPQGSKDGKGLDVVFQKSERYANWQVQTHSGFSTEAKVGVNLKNMDTKIACVVLSAQFGVMLNWSITVHLVQDSSPCNKTPFIEERLQASEQVIILCPTWESLLQPMVESQRNFSKHLNTATPLNVLKTLQLKQLKHFIWYVEQRPLEHTG